MKAILVAVLVCIAGLAQAEPGDRQWILSQRQADPRHMPPPGGHERWEERRRLREEVRDGRVSREEAVRQYRERFPERTGEKGAERHHHERRRMSPEERDQMRRDIHEANRNLRKR